MNVFIHVQRGKSIKIKSRNKYQIRSDSWRLTSARFLKIKIYIFPLTKLSQMSSSSVVLSYGTGTVNINRVSSLRKSPHTYVVTGFPRPLFAGTVVNFECPGHQSAGKRVFFFFGRAVKVIAHSKANWNSPLENGNLVQRQWGFSSTAARDSP